MPNGQFPQSVVDPESAVPAGRYRPTYHFTPHRNWMNDPNGLVHFDGEYHLFYQYNPLGIDWGHMSWGHAVSRDLTTWEELPVAIPETAQDMIFSGCAIIDWDNVSGLGAGTAPPMLAYFTAHDQVTEMQTQHLAYSHDRGRTFAHYEGNPLIDLGLAHFRDPKVFYHAPSEAWVMVVALPREHRVQFYRSTNLLDWMLAGAFGPAGGVSGQWECPDLMLVPIQDSHLEARWVLKVDVDAGFLGGGSGAQYFVGNFDGYAFSVDTDVAPLDGDIVDFGPDFYAAVSWSDLPGDQLDPLWIGWMSNHQTGRHYPTDPWRGAQSLPRVLFLFAEGSKLKLGQRPVDPFAEAVVLPVDPLSNSSFSVVATTRAFHFRARLSLLHDLSAELHIVDSGTELISVRFDAANQRAIFFRRSAVSAAEQSLAFSTAMTFLPSDPFWIDLYFDDCLLEIFLDGGRRAFTACIFPSGFVTIDLTSSANAAIMFDQVSMSVVRANI